MGKPDSTRGLSGRAGGMTKALNEDERKEWLARINEAHGHVSAAGSDLRRSYSGKVAVVRRL